MMSQTRQTGFPALLVAAVAAGCLTSFAFGATGPIITDPRGDSSQGYPDIKSVSVATSAQSVTWTVVAYSPFSLANAPCIVVQSVNPSTAQWLVCGNAGNGFAVSTRGKPYGVGGGYAGKAGVGRLHGDASTVVYRVPRQTFFAIKPAPKGYAWQAQSRNQSTGTIYDRAPDRSSDILQLG